NEAGLEVSAVGNHEFDQGYRDLVDRVMAAESASNPDGGAEWTYIGANVKIKASGSPALDPTFVKQVGGVQVGFIGAVTEHLPELVSPGGIADLQVTDIPTAVNAEADALKADGVDVIVLLVHEGAPSTDCATMDDNPASDFGSIVTGVNDKVDAIISGHTHLAYNCEFPVAGWAGRPVTERPVVSAGQYGYNLNQLDFSVDPATGQILSVEPTILPLTTRQADGTYKANYPVDAPTKTIVDAAVAKADVLGAVPLGDIAGPFKRASRLKADGSGFEENRGGESTLGNLVAEAQRWATESATTGSAQIAFMNPGGLRADMLGNGDAYPKELTYKQAANVQPFANTLVNMDLTGAQIKAALEQQWQPAGASRPFLRLGTSKGFTYTYDPVAKTVTGMWLKGKPVVSDQTYSVTVNSFLATGGDNFGAFATGTNKQDTGRTDLQGMVDYMAEFAADTPLAVDSGQRAVGVTFPEGAPAAYLPGDTVAFTLSSLAMTGAGDVQDATVSVSLDGVELGTAPVDNTVAPGSTNDESGTAAISVVLPRRLDQGTQTLLVTGDQTGTTTRVQVGIKKTASTVSATIAPTKVVVGKTEPTVTVTVEADGAVPTGKVLVRVGGQVYRVKLADGTATVQLEAFARPGVKPVTVRYLGDAITRRSHTELAIEVVKE
ncbi:MAG TPA: 5'-nucleotidase C-terminal domain-containing protein, partial [Nocardioides sp.]|nr:5'-nucleotidase C-terminal domain-containing protein [Nocardioides sp.]